VAVHRAAASKERRAQIRDQKTRMEARQADHARKHKVADSLPVPAGASAAAR
jgi:hypothetical protein